MRISTKYQILLLQKSTEDTRASFVELHYADAMHLRSPIYQCTLGFSRWQRSARPCSCVNQPPAPADVYGMREGRQRVKIRGLLGVLSGDGGGSARLLVDGRLLALPLTPRRRKRYAYLEKLYFADSPPFRIS